MAEILANSWTYHYPVKRPVQRREPTPQAPSGASRPLRAVDISPDPDTVGLEAAESLTPPVTSLDALIARSQRGDSEAFGELYDRFRAEILRYLAYQLRDRETSEDLTQQVFLNAWRAVPRYEQRNVPFRAWLYRIARNQLLDYVKSRRRQTVDIDLVNPAADTDIETHAIAEDDRRLLHAALRRLSDDHREVLVLRFLMEKSAAEVGLIMGRKEVTIRGLQFRALRTLRSALEELGGTP